MKHLIKIFFFLTFLTFHVIGQKSLKKNKENARTPNMKSHYCLDMTIVPSGDFTLNSYKMKHLSDDTTLLYANGNVWGRESVSSFYISDHEVTNAEYREFVNWVRDSIARSKLFIRVSGEEKKMWGKYTNTVSENIDNRTGQYFVLNWDTKLDYSSIEIAFLLSDMYITNEDQFYIRKQFDNRLISYTYTDLGTNEKFRLNPYPDTLCWARDFQIYKDPMSENYFWRTAYDNYPVVGVTWNQAIAYCDWRTKCYNEELNKMNARKKAKFVNVKFTLPNSSQWSYASGEDESIHDLTDLPHMRNKQGCYTSNFGCIYLNSDIYVKDYRCDGAFLTAPVKSYSTNIFGLYNMFGNVSEWTKDNPTAKPDNFFRNLVNTCSLVNDSILGATQLYITDPYTKTTKLVTIGSSEHKKMIEQRLQYYDISPKSSLEDILKNYIAFNSVDSTLRDTILRIVHNAPRRSWRAQNQAKTEEKKNELPDGLIEGIVVKDELPVFKFENSMYLYNNEIGSLEVFEKKYTEQLLEMEIRELKQNWQVIERAERKQIPFDGNAIDHCHIVQGGSWASQPNYLNASCKEVYHESESSCKIGFRVVMDTPIIEENGICKNCTSKERKKMRKIQKSLNR